MSKTYDAMVPERFVGEYVGWLPAVDSARGRLVTLDLRLDNVARLTSDYDDGHPPLVETGVWSARSDGNVLVQVRGQAGQTYNRPVPIVFVLAGSHLEAVDSDAPRFGSAGLELIKQ